MSSMQALALLAALLVPAFAAPTSNSCSLSSSDIYAVCGVNFTLSNGELLSIEGYATFESNQLITRALSQTFTSDVLASRGHFEFCGDVSFSTTIGPVGRDDNNGTRIVDGAVYNLADGADISRIDTGPIVNTKPIRRRDFSVTSLNGITTQKPGFIYIDSANIAHDSFFLCTPTGTTGYQTSAIYLSPPNGRQCEKVDFPLTLAGTLGKRAGTIFCEFNAGNPLYGAFTRSKRDYMSPRPRDSVAPVAGTDNSLVLGTMFRDKAQYLKEWIEFHAMVGVERFLLYDNGSKDFPLKVLQPYIDAGLVEYQAWPPATDSPLPAPFSLDAADATRQEAMYKKTLAACRADNWSVHKPFSCQVAASIDMLRRTSGRAEWLGFWDVDEFLFPTETSNYEHLTRFLASPSVENADQVVFRGSIFGTTEGDANAPNSTLVSERYLRRRALHEDGPSPFRAGRKAFLKGSHVKGDLEQTFALPETSARKSVVRPNMAIWSTVHEWVPTAATANTWLSKNIALDDDRVKLNHYAYLSKDEANAKAEQNGNPLAAYDEEQDAFYRAELDVEITWLAAQLRQRLGLSA